jgi:hypothetical protein
MLMLAGNVLQGILHGYTWVEGGRKNAVETAPNLEFGLKAWGGLGGLITDQNH